MVAVLSADPHGQLEPEGGQNLLDRLQRRIADPALEVDERARADTDELRVLGLALPRDLSHHPHRLDEADVTRAHAIVELFTQGGTDGALSLAATNRHVRTPASAPATRSMRGTHCAITPLSTPLSRMMAGRADTRSARARSQR